MILIGDVIKQLRPSYEYVITNNQYDEIDWNGNEPIPYEEFMEAYNNLELIQAEKQSKKDQALAKFAGLGITVEDIKLVLEQ